VDDAFRAAYGRALGGDTDEADTAASLLAASPDWDTAAQALAAEVGDACARRGWRPADLARLAARELDARHRRLAGAAGDLSGFARAERLDRFSAATVFVELMCLYGRLPRIPALDAEAPPATGDAGKMLARIRALLAKAESTGFPEEAEALSAKAQHLMARHSIDAALLSARAAGDGPGARRLGVDRPYEGAKALLLDAVAEANRCQSVWSAEYGFATVVGHAPDLEAVELLYTSLLVQADRALHAGRTNRSRDFRESFLIAYASRIRTRLTSATAEEDADAAESSPELLPALTSRAVAVEDTTRRLFPSTTRSRLRARDEAGWREGESAADAARLRG
jgi:hypothetical protein